MYQLTDINGRVWITGSKQLCENGKKFRKGLFFVRKVS